MKYSIIFLVLLLLTCTTAEAPAYPYDGYEKTGIRRLLRVQKIVNGEMQGTKPPAGALKLTNEISLNLLGPRGDSLAQFPKPDAGLQKAINALFPNLDESYGFVVLDITKGKPFRYAERNPNRSYMPGSVGKLAIAAGLFTELARLYPDSFEKRTQLLKTHMVRAGKWCNPNHHEVPVYNPETGDYVKRRVLEEDVFSLYEWADHMLSASSNAAASIVWKEVVLMRAFGERYPVSEDTAAAYFKKTSRSVLKEISMSVVNDPLMAVGIAKEEWWLGNMFTDYAQNMIPGEGGSKGTPLAFMKFLVAMERGRIADPASSLEIKRLLYLTDRRIRYAAATALANAAVYFKSGSLYKCKEEEGFTCGKYMGNVDNFMNSVAIVEQPDGTTYLVTLMSNVLRKNSANDHFALASQIDKIIRK